MSLGQNAIRLATRRKEPAVVGVASFEVVHHGVDYLPRNLRTAWPVKVDRFLAIALLLERGE